MHDAGQKIEVVGPDAAAVPQSDVHNGWDQLQPGRCKYGIMLREGRLIYDERRVGAWPRTGSNVTTTTKAVRRGSMQPLEDYSGRPNFPGSQKSG